MQKNPVYNNCCVHRAFSVPVYKNLPAEQLMSCRQYHSFVVLVMCISHFFAVDLNNIDIDRLGKAQICNVLIGSKL